MKPSTDTRIACAHCGTPFHSQGGSQYCCQGCAYVAGLLKENGLDRFYELKGQSVLPPVGTRVFHEDDLSCITEAIQNGEANGRGSIAEAELSIQGISCLGCVWLIEALFAKQPGAVDMQIDVRNANVHLRWESGRFDGEAFAREMGRLGYRLSTNTQSQSEKQSTGLGSRLGLCGFFLLNTMLFTLPSYLGMEADFFLAPLFQILSAFFATLSLVIGGSYFFKRAWSALRHKRLHIDLPIALGLLAAYSGSIIGWIGGHISLVYFDFVATFSFLMLGGRWLQELALQRSQGQLNRQQSGPGTVTLIGGPKDGLNVQANTLERGTDFAVSPGAVVPVSSRLLEPAATLSLEWINGEAEPLTWEQGQPVPAGAVNVGLSALRLSAEEAWGDSLLSRLMSRPPESFRQVRLEKILAAYLGIVMVLAGIGAAYWAWHGDAWTALQVAVSVLVVSCPCALGVALPLADELAAGSLRRAGLFIKSADIWERVRRVRCVVFDKTGTLTLETPRLLNPEALDGLSSMALNALHALVSANRHPVARALRETLILKVPGLARVEPVSSMALKETVGRGLFWKDPCGVEWSLGRADWPEAGEHGPDDAQAVLRSEGKLVAAFYLSEDVRDEARQACDELREEGLRLAILSGDASLRVDTMAEQLNIDAEDAHARCSPEDKADWLEQNAPGAALMIGDGANDSLAFNAAICRGTPVVDRALLESTADFFFFGRSLRGLPLLFRVAKARRRTVATIFALAVSYNLGAITLCLSGAMHPLLAAILMPLSSLLTLAVAAGGLSSIRS